MCERVSVIIIRVDSFSLESPLQMYLEVPESDLNWGFVSDVCL